MNDDILKTAPQSPGGDGQNTADTPAPVQGAAQESPVQDGAAEEFSPQPAATDGAAPPCVTATPADAVPSDGEAKETADVRSTPAGTRAEDAPISLPPEDTDEVVSVPDMPDIAGAEGVEVTTYSAGADREENGETASPRSGGTDTADPEEELPDGEAVTEVTPTVSPAPDASGTDPEPAAAEDAPKPFFLRRRAKADEERRYDPDDPRRVDGRFDFVELFIYVLCAVLVMTSFFFRHSVVDGGSMEGTLHEGDHLIISDCFYTPDYGDIIVVEDYTTHLNRPIVKRVIALAGDTVRITADGRVYRNGELLTEDYVYIDNPYYSYTPMEYTVPQGEIFVMGDHRNSSLDSREFGSVREETVLGKVLFRFYPFRSFGKVA